uniref:WD_REPEATS_REGION domain-containing protein n=1 Tax=Rhabditophanes sp. KR3021 TaxID=114890 RepID=A0AC35U0B0_9BILA
MKRYHNADSKGKKHSRSDHPSDIHPGKPEVSQERLDKHDTGTGDLDEADVKTGLHKKKFRVTKAKLDERAEFVARAELITKEQSGFIELEEGDKPTYMISQREIVGAVDIASASKVFDLKLEKLGPYAIDFTPNGRHLLIGGKMGHLAAFDWMSKSLHCEFNTREEVRCVKWLHNEQMFAASQLRWTHIYDRQGVELHCLKQLDKVKAMEFLPRHFLLVTGANSGFLSYLDVTMGKIVSSFQTKQGSLNVMCANQSNGVVIAGSHQGRLSMYTPNHKEAVVQLLVHNSNVTGVATNSSGDKIVTTGADRRMKIWDVRNMGQMMYSYLLPSVGTNVTVSQKDVVALSCSNIVNVYNDAFCGTMKKPYMLYRCDGHVSKLQFCPYEDVLGVGHGGGYNSLLIPGSGDPNFDGYKVNPYESKKQRQEREVRQLLDKIQPEFITLDHTDITKVNSEKVEETFAYRTNILKIKAVMPKVAPKKKAKGRSKTANHEKRRDMMKEQQRKDVHAEKKSAADALGFGKRTEGSD